MSSDGVMLIKLLIVCGVIGFALAQIRSLRRDRLKAEEERRQAEQSDDSASGEERR